MADGDEAVNKIMEGAVKQGVHAGDATGTFDKLKEKLIELRKLFSDMGVDEFASKMSGVIPQFAKDVAQGDISAAFQKLMKRSIAALNETIVIKVEDFLGIDHGAMQKKAKEVEGALQGALNIAGIDIPLNFEDAAVAGKKLKEALLGAEGFAKGAVSLGEAEAFSKMAAGMKRADDFLKPFVGNLNKYRETAGNISKIQINPFQTSIETNNSTSSAKDAAQNFQQDFAKQAINLRVGLGISSEDANQELAEIYSSLENYGAQLGGIEIKLEGGKAVKGAEAIAYAARATGISVSTLTSDINEMTFTMGSTGPQAVRNLETIGKAASNTLLPVSKFHAEVMTAAKSFSLFGDNTEESAAMLERFISKADPGRIKASVAAFQSVAMGIAGMTDEMKAFVGMGTELAGGGGAIEAIVRMDAALASGDKDALQGIFDEAIARIEELSGAPVMTLKEAVSSGQENTFYQQVKMLEGMGLGKGSAQASDIFAASKRGAIDVETIRAQAGDTALGEGAIAKTRMGRGGLDVAQEMLGGGEDLARYDAMYKSGATNVMKHSDDLAKKFIDLGQAIAGKDSPLAALEKYNTDRKAKTPGALTGVAADSDAAAVATSSVSQQWGLAAAGGERAVNVSGRAAVEGAQAANANAGVDAVTAAVIAVTKATDDVAKTNAETYATLSTEIAALGAKIEAFGKQTIEISLKGDITKYIDEAIGRTVGVSKLR